MKAHIDRLALRLPGLSPSDGRRLAELIANQLLSANAPGAVTSLDRLRVQITARPGEPLETTAARIAAELLSAIARSA